MTEVTVWLWTALLLFPLANFWCCCVVASGGQCNLCPSDDIPEVYVAVNFGGLSCLNPADDGTYTLPSTSPGINCTYSAEFEVISACPGDCNSGSFLGIDALRDALGRWEVNISHVNSTHTIQCGAGQWRATGACKVTSLSLTILTASGTVSGSVTITT